MLPTTIIVPLDGSSLAETAIEPGRALAARFGAQLLLVRATWHRPPDHEQRYLDLVANQVAGTRPTTQTVHGHAAPTISALIEETPGSMLCLSTRGHTGLVGEVLLGSVAAELLDEPTGPILLVGPSVVGSRLGLGGTGPILFCFDASVAARSLEPVLISWAEELDRAIEVVTVLHRDGEFLGAVSSDAVCLAAKQFLERLEARGISGRHRVIDCIDPARAILREAKELEPALIAAGMTTKRASQGLARLSRVVLGSTAERLVRHSPAPVLVAQP